MKVTVIEEAGLIPALLGLGLSFGKTSDLECSDLCKNEWLTDEGKAGIKRMISLAHKQKGHNKSLESVMLYIDVTAPLYWWKQADTYRVSSKQSESTMHTLMKKKLTMEDFEGFSIEDRRGADQTEERLFYEKNMATMIETVNEAISKSYFRAATKLLPDDFLQRRIWCMSYKSMQNIYQQRSDHKLIDWHFFCDAVLSQVSYPELIKAPPTYIVAQLPDDQQAWLAEHAQNIYK